MLGKYIVLGHPDSSTSPSWPDESLGQVIDVSCEGEEAVLKALGVVWDTRMPPELLARLESGEKVNVSVGFQTYSSEKSGEWKGKPYSVVADRIYYEHIGIVPVGACTPEDGCSAQIIVQTEKVDGGNTDGETDTNKTLDVESKTVNQAVGAPVEAVEPEVPPPLFKDPDEMLQFTNQALSIQDNDELKEEQLRTAFSFVMDNLSKYGWSILDIQDPSARHPAMAAFVARAAGAWKNNDPLFSPPGEEQVANSVTQSQGPRSWRGDEKMPEKKNEEGAKTLHHYPVLSQTEDGTTQITWNSTEDPKEAESAKITYDAEFKKVLGSYDETMKDLKAQADAGLAADGVARSLLLGSLKSALPKLNDTSLEKYKSMGLDALVGIVNDLGQNITVSPAAPEQAPGLVTQTPETKPDEKANQVIQSPTPVNLQKIRENNKMTFAEAQKRLKKELGMDI